MSVANQSEIERLLHHMPVVAERSEDAWVTEFCRSIARQSRRRNWKPTTKQLSMMRRLVADLFALGSDTGGDVEVIE